MLSIEGLYFPTQPLRQIEGNNSYINVTSGDYTGKTFFNAGIANNATYSVLIEVSDN